MERLREEHYAHYIDRLGTALLACPTLINPNTREQFFEELPFRAQLNDRLPNANSIIRDLIRKCANYSNGENILFEKLNVFEKDLSSFKKVQEEWQRIKQEIDEQDKLVRWIKASGVSLAHLGHLFDKVVPEDYVANPDSVEILIKGLWEMPSGHLPLVWFVQELQEQPDLLPALRDTMSDWVKKAPHNEFMRLDKLEQHQSSQSVKTRLIVTIEFGTQDLNERLVSLWLDEIEVDKNHNISKLGQVKIERNRLEQTVSEELYSWVIAYDDTEAIEFYLPKALLAMPVHNWKIKAGRLEERFVHRYQVVKGVLERQRARLIRDQINVAATPDEKRELVRVLENNPLIKDLTRCNRFWKKRWKQLHNGVPVLFAAITQAFIADDIVSGTSLLLSDNVAFALLKFSPPNLESNELDDPIGQLMQAGVPLLAWVHSFDGIVGLEDDVHESLFDTYYDHHIRTANDVIDLMHSAYRTVPNTNVHQQIRQNLNLILDNPMSNLPTELGRVRM